MSLHMVITASAAPPWAGPLSVATPATIAPWTSAQVLAATRAPKAEALEPCSAWSTKATSIRPASARARQCAVRLQFVIKGSQRALVRQFLVEQQIRGLLEGRVLCHVVDVVAPVQQLPDVAIDEAGFGGREIDPLQPFDDLGLVLECGHSGIPPWWVGHAEPAPGTAGA